MKLRLIVTNRAILLPTENTIYMNLYGGFYYYYELRSFLELNRNIYVKRLGYTNAQMYKIIDCLKFRVMSNYLFPDNI